MGWIDWAGATSIAEIEGIFFVMVDLNNKTNQRMVIGCGGAIILCFFIFAAGGLYYLNFERNSAIYPEAAVVTQNSNYKNLPSIYIWNDSYRSQDDFNLVFNWYSQKFDMGPESRAIGSCAGMDKVDTFFLDAPRCECFYLSNRKWSVDIFGSRGLSEVGT